MRRLLCSDPNTRHAPMTVLAGIRIRVGESYITKQTKRDTVEHVDAV